MVLLPLFVAPNMQIVFEHKSPPTLYAAQVLYGGLSNAESLPVTGHLRETMFG